ncbi:hypothetical protein CCR94_02570 [Rhodoblastus sphagnicola]|uniref:Uncharacterized protein n=1 Tax=Rhodoblastus sphagnicola TaxID=333368 RepID=A0A2S6NF68_9HYPH|nr:hypothetical protein [Rhodoblastus sphagnicola]MBB4200118.1 hypothetical protein [Rhodoblastus sphagnicola]PPQ33219.1 hypothetical protein CCR94_02570 [Rhodoblastus sphagnicola]
MHISHIKTKNFGVPHGGQPCKPKPRSVEAELITPVPEWERDGKRRKAAFPAREARPRAGDDDEPADFEQARGQAEQDAEDQKRGSATPTPEDDELARLLGGASPEGPPAKIWGAVASEDATLEELLSRFAGAAKSSGGAP